MRYFLDTEFNGFGGKLISIALTPEHGDQEYYAVLPLAEPVTPWVARHVIPFLHMVPTGAEPLSLAQASEALGAFLEQDPSPVIVADWPDDFAHLCSLLSTEPGRMLNIDRLDLRLVRLPGFSAAANSAVPHNALHDARALREFVLEQEAMGALEPRHQSESATLMPSAPSAETDWRNGR